MITEYPTAEETLEKVPPLSEGAWLVPGYEVMEHLHRSNDYDVYHVWSEERYCGCIAKTLLPDRLDEHSARGSVRGSARDRLLSEGELLKKLAHPNLVRAYETFAEPVPAVILETLTGQTLAHLIETHQRKRLPARQVAQLGLQLCSALRYLHRNDLLHLDLKPSNIVAQPPLAKVMDLSIARPPGQGRKGAGTRYYMAPEQARGGHLSPATDAWGVGAVLFEAATGEAPFAAYEEGRYDQLERRAVPIRSRRRLPTSLANAIDCCLEPEPALRPTMEEFAEDLLEALG